MPESLINSTVPGSPKNSFVYSNRGTLDKVFLCFVIAVCLFAAVFGQYHLYLAQFLILTLDSRQVYVAINAMLIAESLVSIATQASIARAISLGNFRIWLWWGVPVLCGSLYGFYNSAGIGTLVLIAVVFCFVEVAFHQLEFLLLVSLSTPRTKHTYLRSQNLSYFGAASSPLVAGYMFSGTWPGLFFFTWRLYL